MYYMQCRPTFYITITMHCILYSYCPISCLFETFQIFTQFGVLCVSCELGPTIPLPAYTNGCVIQT